GVSIAIINAKETGKIRQIERVIGKKFTKAEVPSGFDVCEKQLFGLVHKVHNVAVNEQQIEPYMQRIMDEFADLEKEDIIKRFASLEFNRFLDYYKNAPDLNVSEDRSFRDRPERGERGDRGSERYDRTSSRSEYTRLFINLGSVDEITRGDMLSFICNNAQISGKSVGKIDLKGVYSFFEVHNEVADKVIQGFKGAEYMGRNVRIENAGDRDRNESRRPSSNSGGGGYHKRKSYGDNNRGGGNRDFGGKRRDERKSRW
ncbi:MAG: DbpA RNA binding domain-containing protein, partial [Mucilaginibacter polytrichastri]|nr:DbpA RNA binding domain-containing protein [Mucilaginibacter polytrichastri]